jgi:hypothetical protein
MLVAVLGGAELKLRGYGGVALALLAGGALALLLSACGGGSSGSTTPMPRSITAAGCLAGTPDASLCATLAARQDGGVDCITQVGTPCPTRPPRTPALTPTRGGTVVSAISDCAPGYVQQGERCLPDGTGTPAPLGTIVDCNPGFTWDGTGCAPDATIGPEALATINACIPGNVTDVNSCASKGKSGIEGVVLAGPTCPVERADSPCPDRPVQAYVWTFLASAGTPVAAPVAETDGDGHFRLALPPGTYPLYAGPCSISMKCPPIQQFPRFEPQTIVVRAGAFTQVVLRGDTGIR